MTLVTALKADRRLYVTADKTRVVEEGDPAGSWLLYAVGRKIGEGDIQRYGLEADEFGRVTYDGCPALPDPEQPPKAKAKSKKAKAKTETETETEEDEAAEGGADDSDRNDGEVLEWPGRTSPEAYLKRYPTGPKADLAKAVIAAQDDGADGGS